jgi:class I fructose-bisphosphate aldolase
MKGPDVARIMTNGKSLLLAYDHGLEHGPEDFQDKSVDPAYVLSIAKSAGFNGIILQKGVAEKYYNDTYKDLPLVVKLNGKTNLFKGEPISEQVCSVEEAVELGASAVGYTIYIGSAYEPKMFEEFGKIDEEARDHNLPVILWAYPRGKAIKKVTPKLVGYAARVGLELGADFVKVKYTGSVGSFAKVVQNAGKCRVLCLGGSKLSDPKFLQLAKNAVAAGASGMAVGRNIWQHKDPLRISEALKAVVFNGLSVDQAMKILKPERKNILSKPRKPAKTTGKKAGKERSRK